MLIDKTVTGFVEELASDSPAPGGGSTAALLGALSAALCVMVMNLTQGEKLKEVAAEVQQFALAARSLKDQFMKYVDEDTQVFNKVMTAYRLPKGTEEEKIKRTSAIQYAMQEAANLPMAVAEASLETLRLASGVIKLGNPNAASDAAVAGVTAYAAFHGALYNVKINLLSIKNKDYVEVTKKKVTALSEQAEEKYRLLQHLAKESIG